MTEKNTAQKIIAPDNQTPQDDTLVQALKKGYNLPATYFDIKVEKAVEKNSIRTALKLEYLTGPRFENFYVQTDDVRNANTISSLQQLLVDPLEPYTKLLFSGFTGSGKTTELIRLCFQLQKSFNIIIFSAWSRIKINEITFESILFEIVGLILDYLYTHQLVDENNELLAEINENIYKWCSQTQIITERKKEKDKSLSVGINFLKSIFFRATRESKHFNLDKTVSTRIEERRINDLIFECNKIFDYLKDVTGKDTIIIIDDLEKMDFLKARQFYIQNSSFLRDFHCKMVLTIPVELIYHPDFSILQNVFGEAEVLPMIKIKDKKGKIFKQGVEGLTRILERRMDLALFEDRCYEEAILYSGGAIRELFHIISRASLVEESNIISKASMQKSVSHFKDIFASRIYERNDEIKIKFEEYLDILINIHDGNKTAPRKNLALLDLLRMRAVMKYNGDGFYDTHPLLDTYIKDYKKNTRKNEPAGTGN